MGARVLVAAHIRKESVTHRRVAVPGELIASDSSALLVLSMQHESTQMYRYP